MEAEFRTGDRLQFTRNNQRAGRNNGDVATVVAVDVQGSSLLVEKECGERQMLDFHRLADSHIRHGWVRTIHSAQGATCDRVMAHLESFRAKTVDAASAYVASPQGLCARHRFGGHDENMNVMRPRGDADIGVAACRPMTCWWLLIAKTAGKADGGCSYSSARNDCAGQNSDRWCRGNSQFRADRISEDHPPIFRRPNGRPRNNSVGLGLS